MSLARNQAGNFVPVREQRRADSGASPMSNVNAFFEVDLNGDESALVTCLGGASTLNATIEIALSPDGVNYYLLPYYLLAGSGGTLPVLSQPLLNEVVNAANIVRTYAITTTGMRKLRVRYAAYTAGSMDVIVTSDPNPSIHPYAMFAKASTLVQSVTGAAGAAVTATLPAVPGFRHYVDYIQIRRSATALLTAAAAPTVCTSTNLPGAPALTFGQDAAAQGTDKDDKLDFGAQGLAASAINTASTVVCPATTGVIWRVNIAYRLGL